VTASRRIAAVAALVAAILVAAVVALLASGTLGASEPEPAPQSRFIVAGDLALTVPSTWRRGGDTAALASLGLDQGLALTPAGGRGEAGLLLGQDRTPANSLVSEPLAQMLGGDGPGVPTAVRLPAGDALRHDSSAGGTAAGPRTVAYLLPTDRGVATAVCYARTAQAAPSLRDCTAMLTTLAVAGARPESVTPDPRLQRTLTAGIEQLNTRRAAGAQELRGKRTPDGQASAATRLGQAHDEVARTLGDVPAPPIAVPARNALVGGITAVGAGYAALARAATANDRAAYAEARQLVRQAEVEVNARLGDLRLLGYGVGESSVAS
jgi:hypothetical protein